MLVVSFPDLYGGKIVAALDRQHPRDLFDFRDLFAKEGIDDKVRKAFIVYLLSHDRPMAEPLAPPRLDISAEYRRGFEGMVDEPVTLDELLKAREDLITAIVGKMPEQHPSRESRLMEDLLKLLIEDTVVLLLTKRRQADENQANGEAERPFHKTCAKSESCCVS